MWYCWVIGFRLCFGRFLCGSRLCIICFSGVLGYLCESCRMWFVIMCGFLWYCVVRFVSCVVRGVGGNLVFLVRKVLGVWGLLIFS